MATRLQHFNSVKALTAKYMETVGVSPIVVYRIIDWAVRWVWKFAAPSDPDRYKKIATIADGGNIPADFVEYAGGAWYVTGGNTVGFHYIDPTQIGYEKNSSAQKALSTWPAIYFEDGLVKTIPSGLTNIQFPYYNLPPTLATASDSTDDGMPQWTVTGIDMAAARALREMSADPQKSDETLVTRQKQSEEANEMFIAKLVSATQRGMREAI